MEDHFENYNVKELGCLNCGKVQEMKVFADVKNDNQYETAVCPNCATAENSKMEKSER